MKGKWQTGVDDERIMISKGEHTKDADWNTTKQKR